MTTSIVWFRNDLRVHDNPALMTACMTSEFIIPLFIIDPHFFSSDTTSANRTRFLQESLQDLKASLKERGSDLIIRSGSPVDVLSSLAQEVQATKLFYSEDYSPYARRRDSDIKTMLEALQVEVHACPGRLVLDSVETLRTTQGNPYQIFTPFYKAWLRQDRRPVLSSPASIPPLPSTLSSLSPSVLTSFLNPRILSPHVLRGGETEGRARLDRFIAEDLDSYETTHNDMAADRTSRMSSYFHFGCVSVREAEAKLPPTDAVAAWQRQLAWRDFYYYILALYPKTINEAFQETYRTVQWDTNPTLFQAWTDGKTGYPIVDAAMRQLKQEGWMHNRARLIVGSFFTKDLWLDWRLGEAYFRIMLLDGDVANNTGNWQWIASIGVDPAPVFRRLYNPTSQHLTYDPHHKYVLRYVPELASVPPEYLAKPWTMPDSLQDEVGCVIGTDYPAPIVDHAAARSYALEQFRQSKTK